MKPKVKELVHTLTEIISAWQSVEAICLNEAVDEDTLDPYFALILDVYVEGAVPPPSVREKEYPSHSVFETSPTGTKDRCLIGELPVRIEYKSVERINELVTIASRVHSDLWKVRDSGTYVFYRITHCQLLFHRSDWFNTQSAALESLDESFWLQMRSFYRSTMEHFLNDLGAAIVRDDPFHYMVTAASFIKSACAVLCMENGEFEPSHRRYLSHIASLKTLPDDFVGRFESFLRPDSELPPQRKYEIAKLLAKSIVGL